MRNISVAERAQGVFRNEDLPWERRDHGLFVCYAPYDKRNTPCRSWSNTAAAARRRLAPPARDILLFALHGGVPPVEAYPSDQARADADLFRGTGAARAAGPRPVEEPGMSYLEHSIKRVPTRRAEILYINWALVLLIAPSPRSGS